MASSIQIDSEFLERVVDYRAKVQKLALLLLRHLREKKSAINNDDQLRSIALNCVGATFSLWRAVPLVHRSTDSDAKMNDAIEYLEKVVRHNTITYNDDVDRQGWVFGYYVNSANLRLLKIASLLPQLNEKFHSAGLHKKLGSTIPANRPDPFGELDPSIEGLEMAVNLLISIRTDQ